MGTCNYSDEFKRDAVHQITVRGYPDGPVAFEQQIHQVRIEGLVRTRAPVDDRDFGPGAGGNVRKLERDIAAANE